MAWTIHKRHWGAILKSDDKYCSVCGIRASHSLVETDDDDDDIVTYVEWFCEEHLPLLG
jgi:hypothetical protein